MNTTTRSLLSASLALGAAFSLRAEVAAPPVSPAPAPAPTVAPAEKSPLLGELEQLVGAVVAKVKAADGQIEAAQLSTEFAQFDALVAKYPEAKPEERAGVLYAKALICLQVFEDYEQGAAIVRRFKTEFPTTEFAAKSGEILAAIEQERQAAELRKALVVGAVFPGIEGKALDGTAVSSAALKGKVVLVDFWATWCPPCREEIPNVLAAYEKFHAKGFEVLAVSLDRDDAELKKFIAEKKLPWPQIYDGAEALAEKFAIEAIPTTFLVGADGKIVATELRGDALAKTLEALLGTAK